MHALVYHVNNTCGPGHTLHLSETCICSKGIWSTACNVAWLPVSRGCPCIRSNPFLWFCLKGCVVQYTLASAYLLAHIWLKQVEYWSLTELELDAYLNQSNQPKQSDQLIAAYHPSTENTWMTTVMNQTMGQIKMLKHILILFLRRVRAPMLMPVLLQLLNSTMIHKLDQVHVT